MKKSHKSNKVSKTKLVLIIGLFIMICLFPIFGIFMTISNILIDYNLLLGYLLRNIIIFLFLLTYFILFLLCCVKEIKLKKVNNTKNILNNGSLYIYLITIFFGVSLFYEVLELIDIVKDWSYGTKEIYLDNYEIKRRSGRRLALDFYIVTYYDEDGKKHELRTTQSMGLYEYEIEYENSGLRIKYYENLGMFEEYEYIEK